MAKDLIGNIVQTGDKISFNGMICTVKEIHENRLLGGKLMDKNRGMAVKIPDTMYLEIEVQYDAEKPCNFLIIKTPPNLTGAEA
jgi:hypothetical protein